MRRFIVSALVVAVFVVKAHGDSNENLAESTECKEITARLIEATGASFDRYSPGGTNVFLKNPDMVLSCTTHHLTGVSLAWKQNGFPPNEWFELLAKAGRSVTSVSATKIEDAARKCHRSALRSKDEMGEVEIPKAKIECQAFTRDGGSVVIFVWLGS